MIGRKIVDYSVIDCEKPQGASTSRPAGLKPYTLTIKIDTTNVLQGAARPRDSLTPCISPSPYTPNTSHTFGIPNPTSVTSSTPEESDISRRRQRYSLAEQALACTLQGCNSEASPQELQIKVLEQATTLLSAHAIDAQERAAKLRSYLADRGMDPEAYESLQRERWMEEKRQAAVDFEAKMLRQHLLSLTESLEHRGPEKDHSVDQQDRRLANLARFFQASLTRTPITPHNPSSLHLDRSLRRRTLNDSTLSIRRASSVQSPFPNTKNQLRSRSLDGRPASPPREGGVRPRMSNRRFLSIVTEDAVIDRKIIPKSPTTTPPPSPTVPVSPVQSTHESSTLQRTTAVWNGLPTNQKDEYSNQAEGTATIYRPTEVRSKVEILSGMAPLDVELPDYAKELIDDLDYIRDRIHLTPGRMSRLLSPRIPMPFSAIEPPHRPLEDILPSPRRLSLELPAPERTVQRKSSRSHLASLFSRFGSDKPPSVKSPKSPKSITRKRSFFGRFAIDNGCRSQRETDDRVVMDDPQYAHLQWAK